MSTVSSRLSAPRRGCVLLPSPSRGTRSPPDPLARTQLIWAETPTNPCLSLVPIRLIAAVAKRHGVFLVIDNTFASPYLQQPLLLGADLVVASSTKYISGHSDVVGGLLATGNPAILSKVRFLQNAHGAVRPSLSLSHPPSLP